MDLALQLLVNGLIDGSQYALMGIGFGLIFATTKITHFAYGPLYSVAGYACWVARIWLLLPVFAAAAFGICFGALAGVGVYLLVYRLFERRRSSHRTILIASLGLFIVIENLLDIVFGSANRSLDVSSTVYLLGNVVVTSLQLWEFAAFVVVSALLFAFLRFMEVGKAILAMTDNPEMAQIIGIDVVRISAIVFALGSAVAGVPAILVLLKDGMTPYMGFTAVFMGFLAVIVGGIGSLVGAVAGGFVLGLVGNLGMWGISTAWQSTMSFMVLFVVLVVRPQGFFPRGVR